MSFNQLIDAFEKSVLELENALYFNEKRMASKNYTEIREFLTRNFEWKGVVNDG